jgi:hypothetical protein
MAKTYPPIFINDYLQEKIGQILALDTPFFPTSPSTIEQLTTSVQLNNDAALFAVYDRMFKMRRGPFPHIKCEQLLYYFYSINVEAMIETTQLVSDILDRGDESAQDLNSWIQSKLVDSNGSKVYIKGNKEFSPVLFHDIKIYQLEESRDIVDFGTARTFAGNKIIIDYDYHTKGYAQDSNSLYNDTQI